VVILERAVKRNYDPLIVAEAFDGHRDGIPNLPLGISLKDRKEGRQGLWVVAGTRNESIDRLVPYSPVGVPDAAQQLIRRVECLRAGARR